MSTIPLRPLGFGEIVDGAVQLYRRDFGLYYLIALVAALPGYVLQLVFQSDLSGFLGDPDLDVQEFLTEAVYALTVNLTAFVIAWAGTVAVAVAMAERIEGRRASVGHSYRNAIGHLPSALGATVVAMVMFFAVGMVVMIASTLVSFPLTSSGNALLTILGGAVLLVPIAVVGIAWIAATFAILPAVIIEGRPAMAALKRSLSLCNGGWLRVIGIMVVATIIRIAPSLGITFLFGVQDLFTSPEALETIDAGQQWLLNTADFVIAPLTTPFMVGSIMILFHDRRVRKEAYDLETAAGTMDTGTR